MYVTVTEAAYKKIVDTIPNEAKYIKLFYDNEGCGCVMSGIIDLVAVAEKMSAMWILNQASLALSQIAQSLYLWMIS